MAQHKSFDTEASVCPVCGNTELTYGDSELRDELYVYDWACAECGASGEEQYRLEFVGMVVK